MESLGGQVGDQGYIFSSDCVIKVNDTQKKMGDLFVHYGKIEKGSISVGQNVNLEIDILKRNNSRANHSATHLLHESLKKNFRKACDTKRIISFS